MPTTLITMLTPNKPLTHEFKHMRMYIFLKGVWTRENWIDTMSFSNQPYDDKSSKFWLTPKISLWFLGLSFIIATHLSMKSLLYSI